MAETRAVQTLESIAVPAAFARFRRFELDGALLLFNRATGVNALCEGPETEHLRQRAPRVVQLGLTNHCNMACEFCSRDTSAASTWSADDLVRFAHELADAGVLEIAFGGGEPWAFPRFDALVRQLHAETPLAINFTTNGLAMTAKRLERIRGCYGQLRLSLYDDNDWRTRVAQLVHDGAEFGVNYLVTPKRVETLANVVLELAALGCRDVLLLSYNGHDAQLHLRPEQAEALRVRIRALAIALRGRCSIKLDVCWGDRLHGVPRLFERNDCGAGRDFVVVTSDRKLMSCSFHHEDAPLRDGAELIARWRDERARLAHASAIPGCARVPGYGLAHAEPSRVRLEVVS